MAHLKYYSWVLALSFNLASIPVGSNIIGTSVSDPWAHHYPSRRNLPQSQHFPASPGELQFLNEQKGQKAGMTKAVEFMRQYGYLPSRGGEADFVFSIDSIREKLKLVQKYGAIPQTGELDEATLKLMSSPRCGVEDVAPEKKRRRKKRFIIGGKGWNKRNITYTVANWSPQLHSKEAVQRELRKAFDAWSAYSHLSFEEIEDNSADIIIYFATYDHYDGYPFDGAGGILAHAYYPYEFGSSGGDVHFDESETWTIEPKEEYEGLDFFTVAVHEIGHSLGLAHSHAADSIMFPYYKGYHPHFALDYDDIMAMWELYIRRKLDGDDEYFRGTTSTTTTTTTTTEIPIYPSSDDGTQNDEGFPGSDPDVTENELDVDGKGKWKNSSHGKDDDEDYHVRYHGDSETVDEHEKRWGDGGNTERPSLPRLPGDEEKEERRRRDEERREAKRKEEEKKRQEERRRDEERRRHEEKIRREKEERKRNEERRRHDEERRREEEERRREEERWKRREEEERRRWEEDRRRREEETRIREEEERNRRREEEKRRREWEERNNPQYPHPSPRAPPDICEEGVDAAAVIRGDFFLFKGKFIWRYKRPEGALMAGYPSLITDLFIGLPSFLQRVDDVYQRSNDSNVVLFVGKYFYIHDGRSLLWHPRPLQEIGLPEGITQLDAAMYWPKNDRTYLFRRNMYWRRDDAKDRLDDFYPRDIKRWNGVPGELDAAFTDEEGVTYFYKGNQKWRYDNVNIRPTLDSPSQIYCYK